MSTTGLTEQNFAEMIAENGGRLFRTGACVRDSLLGIRTKQIDFTVVGMVKKNFKLLFPQAKESGTPFPVFYLMVDGIRSEVAFARTEQKTDDGQIRISAKPKVGIEADLLRRDTTINAMAKDSLTGEIIDPYQGQIAITDKVLKATSSAFVNDPLNALHLAGQAAQFGFTIEADTLVLARGVQNDLMQLPYPKMLPELVTVMSEAQEPSRFFKVLKELSLLSAVCAELAAMPMDKFSASMLGLDAVANLSQNPKVRFAALGFALTADDFAVWSARMSLPADWVDAASTFSQGIRILVQRRPADFVDMLLKLRRGALDVAEFDLITQAVAFNIPPLQEFKDMMTLPKGAVVPPELKGTEIRAWVKMKQVEAVAKKMQSLMEKKVE